MVGEVATLQHEARNHTVERAALEAETFLVCAQSSEVLGGLWHDVRAQLCVGGEEKAVSPMVILAVCLARKSLTSFS